MVKALPAVLRALVPKQAVPRVFTQFYRLSFEARTRFRLFFRDWRCRLLRYSIC